MSSAPRGFDLPKRLSLSAQSAAAIRRRIAAGQWRESLPSERRLCELFQVSRPTIRTALQQLAQEGLIEIHHGRRNRLLARPPSAAPESRLIVLVTHRPITQTSLTAYQGITEMRAHLAEHGFATEILVCQPGSPKAQQRKVDTFLRQNAVFCCVLLSLSKELQEWFAARATPALVLGSCHPEVKLPSLDVDYRAVCRHAAGVFQSKGHRRLAFIVPNSGVAGDLASEAGFREGCAARAGVPALQATIVRHNGTVAHLTARLEALFAAPERPTALLVAKPNHLLIVLVYCLRHGIRVPDAVSLISRDWDHLFEDSVAHYRFDDETFAHRLSRLMSAMVSQGYLKPEPDLIFPRYVPAGTVKAIPTRE